MVTLPSPRARLFCVCISRTKAWARLVSRVAHPSALPGVLQSLAGQSYMESLERKAQVLFCCFVCLLVCLLVCLHLHMYGRIYPHVRNVSQPSALEMEGIPVQGDK